MCRSSTSASWCGRACWAATMAARTPDTSPAWSASALLKHCRSLPGRRVHQLCFRLDQFSPGMMFLTGFPDCRLHCSDGRCRGRRPSASSVPRAACRPGDRSSPPCESHEMCASQTRFCTLQHHNWQIRRHCCLAMFAEELGTSCKCRALVENRKVRCCKPGALLQGPARPDSHGHQGVCASRRRSWRAAAEPAAGSR